jgi:hypothetical protein
MKQLIPAMILVMIAGSALPASAQVTTNIFTGHSAGGDGTPFSGLVGTLDTPGITFGTDNAFDWHPFGLSDFGSQSSGVLQVLVTGVHGFALTSDDGSSLFIDSSLVVDNGGAHAPTTVGASVFLTAGLHPFTVNFFEDFGGSSGLDMAFLTSGVSFVEPPTNGAVPEPETYALMLTSLVVACALLHAPTRRQPRQGA